MAQRKPYLVDVNWGRAGSSQYEFASKNERTAFVLGIEEALGKQKYVCSTKKYTTPEEPHNHTKRSDNKSGINGVHWNKDKKRWVAQIRVNGIAKHLGYFFEKEDAEQTRLGANKKYGFHENHGTKPVEG